MSQEQLFGVTTSMHGMVRFHGPDVTRKDEKRLTGLLQRVYDFMADGRWHTLSEIRDACGGSEASVSARLRDLRRPERGKYTIERERTSEPGVFVYKMRQPERDLS